MEISSYALESLRHDDEFILYRGNPRQSDAPFVLLLMPASSRPTLESLKKLEHDCSLRDELDATWAVRPLELSHYNDQTVLVLEDRRRNFIRAELITIVVTQVDIRACLLNWSKCV